VHVTYPRYPTLRATAPSLPVRSLRRERRARTAAKDRPRSLFEVHTHQPRATRRGLPSGRTSSGPAALRPPPRSTHRPRLDESFHPHGSAYLEGPSSASPTHAPLTTPPPTAGPIPPPTAFLPFSLEDGRNARRAHRLLSPGRSEFALQGCAPQRTPSASLPASSAHLCPPPVRCRSVRCC